MVSFDNNFKYLGDLPFVVSFDFDTTTGSGLRNYLDVEEMYPSLSFLIFAFHPKLDIKWILVVRGFQHTLDELIDISYLKTEMIDEADPIMANQLRDCTMKVCKKKKKSFQFRKCFLANLNLPLIV